jgi:YidC/Oxa1 family membrane protein insertase
VLADKIISVDNAEFLKNSGINTIQTTVAAYGKSMNEGNMQNGVVDVLNRLSTSDMATIAEHYDLSQLTYEGELILSNDASRGLIDTFNNFLGINMGNSPWYTIKESFEAGAWLVLIGALAIPVLSAVTQWINTKLMPSADNNNGNDSSSSMAESMKTMNKIMPFMSAWFCFTLPAGLGIYWVAGSVVRSIQQVVVNKYIDKNLDMNKIVEKNAGKSAKKMEKMKKQQEIMNAYANMNTKNIKDVKANQIEAIRKGTISASSTNNVNNKPAANNNNNNAAPKKSGNSMMSKANLVKDFNERNNK